MSLLSLPVELLEQIISELDPADLARLMACNNRELVLHERKLYNHKDTRDKAMLAACRLGLVRIIRRLVLDYRAPASSVPMSAVFPQPRQCGVTGLLIHNPEYHRELTLYTTAAYGQVEAFSELLRLGARVDVRDIRPGGVTNLIERLFTPNNDWALLHVFYEGGLDAQVDSTAHSWMRRPILRVIQAKEQEGRPPLRALQMLLDRETRQASHHSSNEHTPLGSTIAHPAPGPVPVADPCFLVDDKHEFLAAAMRQTEYDPIPVLDLLWSSGASIDVPRGRLWATDPLCTPIFAATEVMATRGDTRLVEWCIQHGANLNHLEVVNDWRLPICYRATPALFYVVSFDFWIEHTWDPVLGLQFLFNCGAETDFSRDDIEGERPRSDMISPSPQSSSAFLWSLKCLLRKWGIADMVKKPNYRRMMEYLNHLNAESRGTTAAETLSDCETALSPNPELHSSLGESEQRMAARQATIAGWEALVREIVLPTYGLNATQLLAEYIAHQGRSIKPVEHLARSTIQALLEAGADINARWPDADDGSILLHELCRTVGRVWIELPGGCGTLCTAELHVRSFSLIKHVLGMGADRGRLTQDGRTAKELLLERLGSGACERLARLGIMLDEGTAMSSHCDSTI
ncbi:hypothetical protein BJY00DRAFT_319861 [Aspergillus carlsbadensis]|nr:hypothetical protein BJY00DRAFT_319861 [Aspergillus carlsbadensis]